MKPRFLLDEHVNRAIQRQLRRLDHSLEVLAIGDEGAPEVGTTDPADTFLAYFGFAQTLAWGAL